MPSLYPDIEPHDSGLLDVGDGHRIYWEVCGAPAGKPALALHGGPGSGCTVGTRRFFDPGAYRIVLFDQRNAGRSAPHASEPDVDLSANTTDHLLADIEFLRGHLDIDRWLVFGVSWGSTLALAYAQRHPDHVSELVLASVATTTRREIDWITRGVGMFLPEQWERFRRGAPAAARDGDLAQAYHRLLMHPDPAVHEKAARDWCDWEAALVAIHPSHRPNPRYKHPVFRLSFARLVTHYWGHNAWLEDDALRLGMHRLAKTPGVLIHGRLDISGPLITPWQLAQQWPSSELVIVDEAGHDTGDPGMSENIVVATDRFRADDAPH